MKADEPGRLNSVRLAVLPLLIFFKTFLKLINTLKQTQVSGQTARIYGVTCVRLLQLFARLLNLAALQRKMLQRPIAHLPTI